MRGQGVERVAMRSKLNPPAPAEPLVILDAQEAAELLRVSTRTIRRWITVGRLPAARTTPGPGGKLLIKRDDLLRSVGLQGAPA